MFHFYSSVVKLYLGTGIKPGSKTKSYRFIIKITVGSKHVNYLEQFPLDCFWVMLFARSTYVFFMPDEKGMICQNLDVLIKQ